MLGSAIFELAAAQRVPRIAAATPKRTVQIWDLTASQRISQFETVFYFGGRRIALSPDGDRCAAAEWNKGRHGGVACYDAVTGNVLWQRSDIRHTQAVRFSASGEHVYCRLNEGPLQQLNAATGETTQKFRGAFGITDSPYSTDRLLEKSAGFLVQAAREFVIPRESFAPLDAAFSPDALCLSEGGGPVRCFDCHTAHERWRYQPPPGCHITRLVYRPADGNFYGVELRYQEASSHHLIRCHAHTGQPETVRLLPSPSNMAFVPAGDLVLDTQGEMFDLATGKSLGRLEFPQREYPDPKGPAHIPS
ncbi:MAG: PQQ-binding-like beta-propeller repeat protein [Acidobacteria bacterium]|nr:PQQ-binding-like beta-propeller repeat protein [Acidobacteriota bacterium]